METTKVITEEIRKQLRKPLPKEAIKQHPTKKYLSTIKAIYVVERINDVFGVGKWRLPSEVIDSSTNHIVVKAHLSIPEYGIELESFGGNDNADLGDAYKGATTDALTKIASMLEIGIDVFKGYGDKQAPENIESVDPDEPVKEIIKAAIDGATNQKMLIATWNAYPEWHNNKDFASQLTAKKEELKNKPKESEVKNG